MSSTNESPKSPQVPLTPADRFEQCRWRSRPKAGRFCTHTKVRPLAGEQSFDPDAWCGDCSFFKPKRVASPPTGSRLTIRGPKPDVLGFGSSQSIPYFTGHPRDGVSMVVRSERSMTRPRDLCDPHSDVCHAALEQLSDVLDHLGFTVRKKSPREATLRVYPNGYNNYPLLNPRFEVNPMKAGQRTSGCSVVFTVLSRGDELLDQGLRRFASTRDCAFLPAGTQRGRYFHHGDFVLPIKLASGSDSGVDFASLADSLKMMRQYLQAIVDR